MAGNQPYDHSDDDTAAHGSLGANGLTSADMELTGMGEGMHSGGSPSISPAQEAAGAAQKTAIRSTTSSTTDSPMSMRKKKGNQPR